MMTIAQYIAAVEAVFEAADFDASFLPQGGNYQCTYNAKQITAQKTGSSNNIQFVSSDQVFNQSDNLSAPTQINPIANALMAYCTAQPH